MTEGIQKRDFLKKIVSGVGKRIVNNIADIGQLRLDKSYIKRSDQKSKDNLDLAAKKYALKGTNLTERDVAENSGLFAPKIVKEVLKKRKAKREEYKKNYGI